MRYVFRLNFLLLFCVSVINLAAQAADVPSKITYQGRILNPDSTPLEAASVSFNVKILDPSGACTLFEENFTGVDMTGSNGVFALNLGTGTRADGQAHSFKDAFSNLINFPSTGACGAGYNPTSADSRKLRLVFNDGTPKTVSPDADLQSVPFALMADRVGGKQVSELLQVNTSGANDLSQANLESAFTAINYPKLMALIGGTSSDYFRSSQPINMSSGQTLGLGQFTTAEETTLTGGLGAGDAGKTWYNSTTNKMMYWDGSAAQEVGAGGGGAVASVFGRTGTVTATAGDYTAALVTNSAAGNIASTNVQAAINELDTEKLALAGGTMTGALDMGANKVTSSATPSTANDLTNKNYVDSAISTSGGSFVAKAGDTMSGALAMGTNKITGLGNPTANQDAATKVYADSNLRGSSLPAPGAGQDGQAVRWNNGTGAWVYYTPVSAGADNLGNHTATTNLQMSGNSVIGNTTASGDLTLESTSNATKGDVIINPNGGNVGIGTASPTGALDVTSTTGAFVPPRMTTTQRDALSSPPNGSVIYNTTTNKMNFRENGAWVEAGSGGGGASAMNGAVIQLTSGGCSISNQNGSWISGASRSSVGVCALTISGFSSLPSCSCSASMNGTAGNRNCYLSNASSSSLEITINDMNGAARDHDFHIQCVNLE